MTTYIGLLIPAGAIALLLLYFYVKAMRNRVPWWAASVTKRNSFVSRGSVYVCHCEELPVIAKVGLTQRKKVTERMKEIERQMTGYPVKLFFAIDYMPFAWAVEQEAHRILKRKRVVFPQGDRMGTEWFSCRTDDELQEIMDAVTQAAFAVRYYAISNNCWPEKANPVLVDMRNGIVRRPIFTQENSPGLKIAS